MGDVRGKDPRSWKLPILTDPKELPLQAWVRLIRARERIGRRLERLFARHGLTPAQFDVLATLQQGDGITQQELSERLLVTKGNVCGLIDRAEAAGPACTYCARFLVEYDFVARLYPSGSERLDLRLIRGDREHDPRCGGAALQFCDDQIERGRQVMIVVDNSRSAICKQKAAALSAILCNPFGISKLKECSRRLLF